MIHPTAIVHPGAEIAEGVEIGPYVIIGAHVRIGRGTTVGPHTVIDGWTEIGEDNRIFNMASVGGIPQDLKYRGEETWLRIGNRNVIREFTTLQPGTVTGIGETVIGDDNLFMAYCHVAHDCVIGNRVIMANGSTLAGHVVVEDFAILGGLSAVHQFVRVGESAMLSGGAMVVQDVLPFTIASGNRAVSSGLNTVGLRRRGFSEELVGRIKKAYRLVIRSGLKLEEALRRIREEIPPSQEVDHFVTFAEKSERGLCR
ncbi:acyl-ACP--UDP-N-acetylglucosamine O-acyltransferase [Geobacter sulfurreducens]|jgi:UDP-N-acetylglucosamine acyltransferase|uniref:Acyl-[acyl-carrier-protein]--UDP-N-acetylglucosamine O-acyltransferase n=1 Tax=Geobacter sulfurreducens (strain ATCC 51573 / DSM 12127 / PCA) TaxID=243231 RepID=Q74AT6_GEOSL|nr:acyl-ACP--UDP-N-acetylglucosamine O-acyltransferase [Geobacter sulfurreducens]AAR35640.1 acyl-(acyl carrier protein)--UDP-N-acetylglucosamine/UDP-2-N-acetylglucose-2,3-diamine 3-O/N-acyltransferase [Geobacter sulfurreducens PCA]ADI85022.1 acyl-(acyl carrier protein)--UDP-N-acetylglucosamine/UDP-2-N-acetylglucose-2,3-diamine 3-O/N-acyltransferase [Geobacter sulfurreducens KN400]AJY68496.1 UDP-N-acetylglucosamine acyltransferase [Geobacter sulfurreducens]QVW34117.1 acyl-ACP--UDP-N-acetylglucos